MLIWLQNAFSYYQMNCFSVQPLQTLGPFLNDTFLMNTYAQIKLPEETKYLRFSPFLDLIQSYSENEHIYLSDHYGGFSHQWLAQSEAAAL